MSIFAVNSTAGTAVAGAATLNNRFGIITSEALTTAAAATYTLTLTNNQVDAGDIVLASVQYGTSTTGTPNVATVTVTQGQIKIVVQNIHASVAVNGTLVISYGAFGAGR